MSEHLFAVSISGESTLVCDVDDAEDSTAVLALAESGYDNLMTSLHKGNCWATSLEHHRDCPCRRVPS